MWAPRRAVRFEMEPSARWSQIDDAAYKGFQARSISETSLPKTMFGTEKCECLRDCVSRLCGQILSYASQWSPIHASARLVFVCMRNELHAMGSWCALAHHVRYSIYSLKPHSLAADLSVMFSLSTPKWSVWLPVPVSCQCVSVCGLCVGANQKSRLLSQSF